VSTTWFCLSWYTWNLVSHVKTFTFLLRCAGWKHAFLLSICLYFFKNNTFFLLLRSGLLWNQFAFNRLTYWHFFNFKIEFGFGLRVYLVFSIGSFRSLKLLTLTILNLNNLRLKQPTLLSLFSLKLILTAFWQRIIGISILALSKLSKCTSDINLFSNQIKIYWFFACISMPVLRFTLAFFSRRILLSCRMSKLLFLGWHLIAWLIRIKVCIYLAVINFIQ